jgi:glycosyltransferase involved in cell wall biosynthesis
VKILVNSISGKMGGGANYTRELAAQIAASKPAAEFVFLVPPDLAEPVRQLVPDCKVIPSDIAHASALKRLWFDHIGLRSLLRREKIDVLFSAATLGMVNSPCRQILLVRNSLFFSKLYREKFFKRRPWRGRLAHSVRACLLRRVLRSADLVMTPSQAILDEVRECVALPDHKAVVNYYGVNAARFSGQRAKSGSADYTLLFTSLYDDHKNLGTLLRAMIKLVQSGSAIRLLTTADPNWLPARVTSNWKADSDLASTNELQDKVKFVLRDAGLSDSRLYSSADAFIYPSVVESFGHPLVEAMAAGLPIIAADVPINRELCGDAALFFSPFDSADLAHKIRTLMQDESLQQTLSRKSSERASYFRWEMHLRVLLEVCNAEPGDACARREAVGAAVAE